MSYNSKLPMDDEYIATGPADIRENLRALKEDQIVDAGMLAGLPVGNASGNIPESNGIVNKNLNADLLDGYEASAFASASHNHSVVTASTAGFMSAVDKTKIDGIAAGAQVNQNAFGNVVVGTTTMQADSVTDTLELAAGNNISLMPDAANDRVTIGVTGTVANATTAETCTGNSATATTTTGNAGTATKLATARTIEINGKIIGTATNFDGSANISIPVTAVVADSCTGNSATATTATTCTGNAVTATSLMLGSTAATFNWAGQNGQPSWLWGGNDGKNMYVYNPSNFNVNSVGGYTAAQLLASSGNKVAILTGTIAHGGTIPLPSEYTQAQCKWMVLRYDSGFTGVGNNWDSDDIEYCYADANRVVHAYHLNGSNVIKTLSANYIIIGVK